MKLPSKVPVMTLPHATLIPLQMMRVYVYEPRYRQMLRDALHSDRMFSVAMLARGPRPGGQPRIAGLGLIRLSIRHGDGTAHVALQGIARVVLAETLRYRPYRLCRIEPLETPACNVVVVDALLSRMRELLQERLELGAPEHFPKLVSGSPDHPPAGLSAKDALTWVDKLTSHSDPGHVTDLVSSEILARPRERQTILETINLEERLRCLIHFLMAEIQQERKNKQR